MGRRGPAPKPTVLRVLEGNPGKRALPKNEPKPQPNMPPIPEWIDGLALEFWNRNAPIQHRLGVLTESDGEAFAALCMAYQRWRESVAASNSPSADWRVLAGERNALTLFSQLSQQFGMTPAARTRVQVSRPAEDDTLGGILS